MGKIAIITGGSRGIGAATTLLAAKAGYDVCINYISDQKAADRIAAECRGLNVRAVAVKADVADPEQVRRLFATCDAELGTVSLLVNNAGVIGKATPLANLTDEVLKRTFAVNVFGSIYCARETVRRMARSAGGAGGVIVNVSSIAAIQGSPGEYVHYAASKGAIETLTVGLAKEVGREGIRVNAVRAGTTNTDIHATAGNPDRPAMVARTAPLGRVAEPEDIGEAILWLASDKAGFATGAILPISGGL
jgi:NAD(P)-dependent dehydrogenase (short-subunit alcohol dehydrogenase family)